jgi:LPS-assembly protein
VPPEVNENRQALLIPNARYDGVLTLDDGLSQVGLTARLIGLKRDDNDLAAARCLSAGCPPASVPYVYGYTEEKVHGMVLADWQRQWIGPGGLVTTPYLGIRADAANLNTSNAPGGIYPAPPADQSLFSITPIAALDVRWPLLAIAGEDTHVIEPIAQLVYRGSNVTTPGITNDDAQSFVLDDTNLFSYDRFSGTDRQETGLRANIGVRYQANFADGSWLELLAGESFHLAGTNSLGIADATQVGTSSGLEDTASYVVLGAKGSFWNTVDAAAKAQIDPNEGKLVRAGFTGGLRWDRYTLGLDYIYLAATPELGVDDDQHEIGTVASAPLPFFDYWRVTGGVYWDLAAQKWLKVQAGIDYDDGYLAYGASISKTGPTASTPDDLRMLFNFRLKGPDGANFALSQGF